MSYWDSFERLIKTLNKIKKLIKNEILAIIGESIDIIKMVLPATPLIIIILTIVWVVFSGVLIDLIDAIKNLF
tara:strand:- start:532 stop:750 length:219 start_codon:yes stop_codon:yes gene_type:complete